MNSAVMPAHVIEISLAPKPFFKEFWIFHIASYKRKKATLPIRSEGQAGADRLLGEFGEVLQNLRYRHPTRQIFEDIHHRDPRPTDARFAAALPWLDGDQRIVVHALQCRERPGTLSTSATPSAATE